MKSELRPCVVLLLLVGPAILMATASDEQAPRPAATSTSAEREHAISALKPLSVLIGDWKGVAQPKRGSSVGAWQEKASARWDFQDDQTTLQASFEPGTLIRSLKFTVPGKDADWRLDLEQTNGEHHQLIRAQPNQPANPDQNSSFVFESRDEGTRQLRCTIRRISEIRMIILLEERSAGQTTWRRMAEIGMTRAGERLASGNTGERQCIVTGGLGTIRVSFEGKTYYVCCEGCQQVFDADPAGTIADYRKRLAEEKR
jgi:hypothetical protein